MKECFQFKDMNMLEHGQSVLEWFDDLMLYVALGRTPRKEWRLPEWIDLLTDSDLVDYETIREYLIYHDCGKPLCRTVDEEGKQHFPNHAQASYERWLEFSDDMEVAELIRMDMDAHTCKGDQIEDFKHRKQTKTLLVAALCEIHSNSTMFGGIDSTSFKIKWKHLNKLGKRCLEG
jgi:hypothetical protein